MTDTRDALRAAIDALEEIALAGMSGSGQESEDGMRDWHARQAWKFIGIAARALEPARAALAAHPVAQPDHSEMAQAVAAADGTLHGAVDYWHSYAIALEWAIKDALRRMAGDYPQVEDDLQLVLSGQPVARPHQPEVAAQAAAVPAGMVQVPDYRGYANLGIGQYVLNHSAAGSPAEVVISIATDEEKAGRQVGEERDNPPGHEIQPEAMAVRIRFSSAAGMDVLENQLRQVRETHFPDHPQGCACRWRGDQIVSMCAVHAAWREALHDYAEMRRALAAATGAAQPATQGEKT